MFGKLYDIIDMLSRLDWDRWIMMGLIGFTVGFIGFLLHQLIDVIADFKWSFVAKYIEVSQLYIDVVSQLHQSFHNFQLIIWCHISGR